MVRAVQRFEVSLKAFVHRDGRALFVREADTGFWELPGGRIDVGEEWEPHAAVLARELREELGPGFVVDLGCQVVTWTRQRPNAASGSPATAHLGVGVMPHIATNPPDGAFMFLAARVGQPVQGEPVLSDEHDQFRWFSLQEARQLRFPDLSGYAKGIEELWSLIGQAR